MHAVMNDHLPVVEYLLEKGANMEAKEDVSDVISLSQPHKLSVCR